MSITIDGEWSEPASDDEADIEAAERRNQFEVTNIENASEYQKDPRHYFEHNITSNQLSGDCCYTNSLWRSSYSYRNFFYVFDDFAMSFIDSNRFRRLFSLITTKLFIINFYCKVKQSILLSQSVEIIA